RQKIKEPTRIRVGSFIYLVVLAPVGGVAERVFAGWSHVTKTTAHILLWRVGGVAKRVFAGRANIAECGIVALLVGIGGVAPRILAGWRDVAAVIVVVIIVGGVIVAALIATELLAVLLSALAEDVADGIEDAVGVIIWAGRSIRAVILDLPGNLPEQKIEWVHGFSLKLLACLPVRLRKVSGFGVVVALLAGAITAETAAVGTIVKAGVLLILGRFFHRHLNRLARWAYPLKVAGFQIAIVHASILGHEVLAVRPGLLLRGLTLFVDVIQGRRT